jgi:hypothetical protein
MFFSRVQKVNVIGFHAAEHLCRRRQRLSCPHQSKLRYVLEIYASALRCTIRQGEIPIAAYFEVKRIGLDRM